MNFVAAGDYSVVSSTRLLNGVLVGSTSTLRGFNSARCIVCKTNLKDYEAVPKVAQSITEDNSMIKVQIVACGYRKSGLVDMTLYEVECTPKQYGSNRYYDAAATAAGDDYEKDDLILIAQNHPAFEKININSMEPVRVVC